ncbi:terminase large subunit [Flavobacterium phage vB_FspS_tant8-1]|uniref:Terminase large subunit n=1 Tax=Flavobacterium phage vB_FspS_tant8-1 TaxID=2686278 RepID=A0A6B9LG39_9CAUD|nr:terminase large subunit [Flavobacterium phage vB_FspS_tant8-1]QHB40967.1 terminase large subunit [Flavobacterium phage vB_FspS_tant8-1]
MTDDNSKKLTRSELLQKLKEQRVIHGQLAKRKLTHFTTFMFPEYDIEWFHQLVMGKLDEWIQGDVKKLAIFMPPQHTKSTMSSEITPAKILGTNPKAKIVVASYSDKLASKFNRKCQDIIDSDKFREIYPGVMLPSKGIEGGNELRNNTFFETIGYKGFFKAVSIGGQLTGDPIDFGIIDDPIKDRKQANSETYRETLWDWYNDVFSTRLHNDSRVLMLFTRWHEDDLAGRLFNPKNKHYNENEAKEWTIICLQALKEDKLPMSNAMEYDDPREIGDALWEKKHSAKKLLKVKETNPTTHASLNQQRPSPATGNKLKREWFEIKNESELPFNYLQIKKDFWIDGAFTDDSRNDETAQMTSAFYNGKLYIFNCNGVRKELNEYLDFVVPYLRSSGYRSTSSVWIEMKASGFGFYSMLKSPNYGSFNCRKINSKVVSFGKMTRVENIQPILASGKVVLVKGNWNEAFIDQCCNFPNDTHDDMVDVLTYAVHEHFITENDVEVTFN